LSAAEEHRLRQVLAQTRSALEALAGVVGTGVGLPSAGAPADEACIQVFVSHAADSDAISAAVYSLLPGDPFCVIVTGPAQPLCI
jgi:hypothetical protein